VSSVRIEQKSYEMLPRDGFTIRHFNTVADIDRSVDFYEWVFGGRCGIDRCEGLANTIVQLFRIRGSALMLDHRW